MEVYLIRHAEPDYSETITLKKGDVIHYNTKFVDLSSAGVKSCISKKEQFSSLKPNVIISSPYKRAVQTAQIISEQISIPLFIEQDLREWDCELSLQFDGRKKYNELLAEVTFMKGRHNAHCLYQWESFDKLVSRTKKVLLKYSQHERIFAVTHKMLIFQFCKEDLPFLGIHKINI